MVRIILLALAILLIIYKLHRINKKVLCAKSYIFIHEIKQKTPIEEANYKANLFDFFKHKDVKAVFIDMNEALQEDYSKQMDKMIFRAETWGFINTHTKPMFKKRKRVKKLLEHFFLTQDPKTFSGNATVVSREIIQKYWDIDAFIMVKLDDRVSALKLLLDQYKDDRKEHYLVVAAQIANTLQDDVKHLDKEDLDILNEWNNIINKKKK